MFSLQAIKHVTAVDGGLLILPDERAYHRASLLRWYGIDRETNKKDFRCEADIQEFGFKFHMNDVNATIGMANFEYLDMIVEQQRSNALYYDNELKDVPGVILPDYKVGFESSYWLYTMDVERHQDFMDWMKECGIMVSRVHERNDKFTCAQEFKAHLPSLDKIVQKMICIPVGWWVSKEDREYIVNSIKKGW